MDHSEEGAHKAGEQLIRYHDSIMSLYCMDPGSRSSWSDPGGPTATASPVPDELLRAWAEQAEGGDEHAVELRCWEVQLVRLLEGIRGQRVCLPQLFRVLPKSKEVGCRWRCWGQEAGAKEPGRRSG